MLLRLIKYTILFLILCNIPSYLLAYFGSSLGSLASYASSLLLLGFFALVKEKHKPLFPFIALGLLYFLLSSINYTEIDEDNYFIKEYIRFMVVVLCGIEVAYKTSAKEVYYIVLIGAISVIINASVFPLANANYYPTYGRYSGFYLNPNFAGSVCLIGYALSYYMKRKWKLIGQIIFTLAGILTFSRTFIVIWLLISIFAIVNDKKNLVIPAIGAFVLLLVFTFSSKLALNTDRFNALQSIFTEEQTKTEVINRDSRTETWSLYYDMIFDRPFLGHGFMKFQRRTNNYPGVHNSYLMVIGEAGILPFLVMLGIYGHLLVTSFSFFKSHPEYFYLTCVLVLALMGNHGYFNNFYNVLLGMFVFVKLKELSVQRNFHFSSSQK